MAGVSIIRRAAITTVLLLAPVANSFYLPGVDPQTFAPNSMVRFHLDSDSSHLLFMLVPNPP